jgi:hypothetical protein
MGNVTFMPSIETLESGIPEIIGQLLFNVHTCMPAQIISFDADLQTATVQPCLKRKFIGHDPINLPVIEDVPVVYLGANDYWITYELKENDYVLLVFCERSLEQWLLNGGIVDPLDSRKFHLSDAIAIPGIIPNPSAIDPGVESGTITIRKKDNSQYIKLNKDGAEICATRLKVVGDLEVTGKASITGDIESTSGAVSAATSVDAGTTITAQGVIDGVVGTKKLSLHTHSFTTPSGPVGPPD